NMIIWVFAALMALLPSSTTMAAAQQHRHTPRTTIVDDKAKQQAANDSAAAAQAAQADAAVAYSDTTSVDEEEDYQPSAYSVQYQSKMEAEDREFAERILDKIAESGNYLVVIIFIIFIGAPISILMMILYFIQQNRRDRIRLAETALKNGQPIPGTERIIYREARPRAERRNTSAQKSSVDVKRYTNDEDLHRRGIKHLAIGLGLMVCCLAFWNNDFLGGIGFLIACYGGGQMYMAYSTKKNVEEQQPIETTEEPKAEESATEEPLTEEPKAEDVKDLTYPKD
ncbi:MAG: DUF6249 domain-containing protein, partial [Prevotella sp.]